MRTKHIIGDFEGFFEGAKTFLTPKIVLSTEKCGRFKWVLKFLNYSCLDSYMVRASACQ
jgi:hypothetical protein